MNSKKIVVRIICLLLAVLCLCFFATMKNANEEQQTPESEPEERQLSADDFPMLILAGVILLVIPMIALVGAGIWVVKLCAKFKD